MEPFQALKNKKSLLYIKKWMAPHFGLVAGFSTRSYTKGQDSPTPLNCALHVGDDVDKVIQNRQTVSRLAAFPFSSWTCGDQTHGNHIMEITSSHRGKGRLSQEDAISATDGIYTREKGIFLTSFYADCVPLYFYDSGLSIVGIAHAGWRGTVAKIGLHMIREWQERCGSDVEKIQVVIGPSIGGCCYEVDDRVADPIKEEIPEAQQALVKKENGKYQLDLRRANVNLLKKAGIRQKHIEITHLCTSCRNDLFFSYRKERGKTGRMAAFIGFQDKVESLCI